MTTSLGRLTAALLVCSLAAGCGGAEARKAKYLERGEQYFAEQNYTKARVELRNALQIDPKDAKAQYLSGLAAEKLNDPRAAVGFYTGAISADPKQMAARAALGRLYLFGGLPDKALELAEPGLAEEPNNAALLTVRGAGRAQLGNLEGALSDAEAAVKIAPKDEYAVALLASLYRRQKQDDKAVATIEAGIAQVPKSTDLRVLLAELKLAQNQPEATRKALEEIVAIAPNDVSQRYRLARFYLVQKQPEEAERVLRDTVRALPASVEAKLGLIDVITARAGIKPAAAELQGFVAKDPQNDKLRLALGALYQRYGQIEDAKRSYLETIEALQDEPGALTARNRLATIALQTNDIERAKQLVAEILQKNPRDNDALILRGNIALSTNDTTAAITDLRTVLRDQPGSVGVMRALARAHLQNNEMGLAEEMLRQAAQTDPKNEDTRLDLAQLLIQSNRMDQGRPLLEQIVAETPTNLRAAESLFRVQLAQKDLDAAKETATTIKQARPEAALGYFLTGIVQEAAKDAAGAVQSYTRALQLEPKTAEPLAALVRLELAAKRPDAAMKRLEDVIAANPDDIVARNLKGELLLGEKQPEAAAAAFEETIAKKPSWWVPYRGLSLAQLAAKRNDAAVDALRRGMKSSEGAVQLGTDLAALHERLGKPEEAIGVYEDLAKRYPQSPAIANNLAMMLVSYRSDPASLQRAQSLTSRFAQAPDAAYVNTRGWVKFKLGDYQASLPLLQQAVDKAPKSPLMRYHLGMAQLRTGNRVAAKENLEVAVAAGTKFVGLDEARAALEEIKRAG